MCLRDEIDLTWGEIADLLRMGQNSCESRYYALSEYKKTHKSDKSGHLTPEQLERQKKLAIRKRTLKRMQTVRER